MNIHRYVLLFTCMGLSACLATPVHQSGPDIRNGGADFQELSVSSFTLLEDVRISPRQAHVSFQRGARGPGAGEFAPHCELEVRQVREDAQIVRAGIFDVTDVRSFTHYVKRPKQKVRLAAMEDFQLVNADADSWIMYAYHFSLHSNDQPNVMRLICGGAYDYPYYARYPGIEDMRLALGDAGYLTFR
jgi:hypothetical protein